MPKKLAKGIPAFGDVILEKSVFFDGRPDFLIVLPVHAFAVRWEAPIEFFEYDQESRPRPSAIASTEPCQDRDKSSVGIVHPCDQVLHHRAAF